jgi:multisubunit Na+/H+ antiporter MnhE subunit
MTRALLVASFALLYLGTLGSLAVGDIAVSLVVGVAVFAVGHTPRGAGATGLRHLPWLPWFFCGVALEILRGSAHMVLVVLGRRPWQRQGIVEVELGPRTQLGVIVSSLVVGLSPGTVLLDVDQEAGVMRFHVIDASDPDEVRRGIQHFYDRYQSRVFP